MLLFILLIELLGRTITAPIRQLVTALDHIRQDGTGGPVAIASRGREIGLLRASVNHLLEDIQHKSASQQMVTMEREATALKDRTPVTEADMPPPSKDREKDALP